MGNIWKRLLSLTLAMVMVLSMVPVQAFAAEDAGETVTETQETEAVATEAPAATEAPTATEAPVTPETTVAPETTEAPAGEPEEDAAVKSVQALIDALPVAVNSAEEAEALNAALAAVSDAIAGLTGDQAAQLDMGKYYTAVSALEQWTEESYAQKEQEYSKGDNNTLEVLDGKLTKNEIEVLAENCSYIQYQVNDGAEADITLASGTTTYTFQDNDVLKIYGKTKIYNKYTLKATYTIRVYNNVKVETNPTDVGGVTYKDTVYTNGTTIKFYPGESATMTPVAVEDYVINSTEVPKGSGTYTVNYSSANAADCKITITVVNESLGSTTVTAAGVDVTKGGTAKEGDSVEVTATPNNAEDTVVEITVNEAPLTGNSFKLEKDTEIKIAYKQLTLAENAESVKFNGYLSAKEQMAGSTGYADVESSKVLEQAILDALGVQFNGEEVKVAEVTIQYFPWTTYSIHIPYTDYAADKFDGEATALDEQKKQDTISIAGKEIGAFYAAFGERFKNSDTDAKEKIVITYTLEDGTNLSVTREISLTEGRKDRTITYTKGDTQENPISYESTDALEAAIQDNVTLSGLSWEGITLTTDGLPEAGETAQVTVTINTDNGDATYVPATSFQVWVKAPDAKAAVTITVAGEGTATFAGLAEDNTLAPGSHALTATPNKSEQENVAYYLKSVEVRCGEETITPNTEGKYLFEGGKNYTVAVTFGTMTLAEEKSIAVNQYTLMDSDERIAGLKEKILTAVVPGEADAKNYTVVVNGELADYDLDNLKTGFVNQKDLVSAALLGKEIAVTITDNVYKATAKVTVKLEDSRPEATITVGDVGEITVTENLTPVTDAVKAVMTTKGSLPSVTTKSAMPTVENPSVEVEVTITVLENKDVQGNSKTVTVQAKLAQYTVTWLNGDGSILKTDSVYYGGTPVYTGDAPTKAETAAETYEWNETWEATEDTKANVNNGTIKGNVTYTPVFNPTTKTYTITWNATSKDGTVLGTYQDGTSTKTTSVKYGSTPVAPEEPEAEEKSFTGWTPEITAVTGAATYTASYSDDTIYKVTFVYGNGTDNKEIRVNATKEETLTKPADPEWEGHVFTGWECNVEGVAFGETPDCEQKEITFTAQWADDANGNGVDDKLETLTVKIGGAGENDVVKIGKTTLTAGEDGTAKYIFDSTNKEETLTITATPVVESKLSKTYVDSITNVGEVTYGKNYVATATFAPVKDMEITVTFADAAFVLKEDRVLDYYPGMTGVTSQNVYETAVEAPKWADDADITVEYLARKGDDTVKINIYSLTFSDNATVDGLIKGALKSVYTDGVIPVEQGETWVELGEELPSGDAYKDVDSYEELINKILNEKLANIDWKNISTEIQNIIADIQESAKYYNAHAFGYNPDETQDIPETIRLTYTDSQRNIQTTTVITLHDYRTPTKIVGSDMTLTYKDFKNSDLLGKVKVQTVDGATVEGATVALAEESRRLEDKSVSENAYEVTFCYAGNDTYKPAEATFQMTIVKASASMDIDNVIVTHGAGYTMNHNIVPGNQYGDAKEIEDSLIKFVVGLDVANLSAGESGITGTKTVVQLLLPEDLKEGLGNLTGNLFKDGVEMSLSALLDALELIDADSLEVLKQALEAIRNIAGDFTIKLGGSLPTDIGTYLYGAVSTTGNYETVLDVAYIIIKPDAQQVYLNWNYADSNGIFTNELLQHVDLGASAYDENTFATKNDAATACVRNLFFGVNKGEDNKPALVLKLYGAGIDPENFERDLGNGGFTQMAFIAEFGNEFYYAIPIVRAFAIVPNTVTVSISDNEGTNFRRTYDGEKQELTITVNGSAPESGLEVTYVGITTKGETYKSATAPVDAGAYVVTAVYRAHDENGKLTGVGMAVKDLLVLPAETETTVDDAIITVGETVKLEDIVHITAVGNPDKTILTAQLATDGSFSEIGMDAISGNVNVDFPQWVDGILKDKAPEIYENGVTVGKLSEILNGKIKTTLESLNLGEELTGNLMKILDQLNQTLNNLPVDANVTFHDTDATVFSQVGVYLVGAMVTDSNYQVSADYGLVVVKPDVQQVYLDWNYHDENGIWTEELLKYVDLYASAYTDPEFLNKDEKATKTITHTFLTVDSNGDVKVSHNAEELSYGAYLELAYIELELDGNMTISDLIARPIVTVPNAVKVEFVDENNTANADRKFSYDGNPHAMDVRVTKNGNPVDVQEGELTVTYRGVTTAGEVYNSTTAPTDAGAYTVTAVYAKYENGKLIDGGAAVGAMVIKPAEVAFSVTGGMIPYDGDQHGVTVEPENVNYTLIAATANVSGAFTEIGFEAMEGVLNVDFPAWVDEILAEKYPEVYETGINANTLLNKLKELNLEGTWVDTLVKLLEKVPSGVKVTFVDNIQFEDPGVYVFAGFLTDFNYVPASDTALLVIQKVDSQLAFVDTEVYYNGEAQSINVINPYNTDYVTVIVDRENNIANILFEKNLTDVKDLLKEKLGYTIPESISVTTLMETINKVINDVSAWEYLPEDVKGALEQLKTLVAKLPQTGTIYIDGDWRPVEVGEYEFYGISISPFYQTKTLSATLIINPAKVTITVKDAEKTEGENDPTNEPDIVVEPKDSKLDTSVLNIQVSRVAGESVGDYDYIVTYTENANFKVTVDAGKLTIKAKAAGGDEDNKSGKYPIYFHPEDQEDTIQPGATVEIDGKLCELDENCTAWVDNKDAKIAQTFIYNVGADAHHTYPTHMYVWYLTFADGDDAHYDAEPIPELTDFFQYHGTSIRVNFTSNGIRFMTSVNRKDANALMGGNLIQTEVMAGYRMTQAGTLFKWGTTAETVLTNGNAASSLVYGVQGESSFRVFQKVGDRDWFTGMLTGLGTDKETLNKDLVSRPYAVLERDGETITIYGGTIQRSIYYVAKQNENWKVGTVYNDYIKKIIAAVEGQ